MTPDYQESLRFLRWMYPSGPWTLTAISVDKCHIDARTFSSDEADEVLAWLRLNNKRNLYYSVNRATEAAQSKRKFTKLDIASVHFLHVDVDPRVGEDVAEEQARILAQLRAYRHEPSAIVFSGGGYNALWRLSEPFLVAEGAKSDEEADARATDVERRNWQFELDFATPDHCRDVSRILRLPGTVNRPDAKKISKGRDLALARVVEATDRVYELSEFLATPHVARNTASNEMAPVLGVAQRVESLNELGARVPERLKQIIAQGADPEDPKRWGGDRSAALFHVCCELVRCGVDDEVILGIITDSRYLISESVLDKGSGTQRYAVRQVQRAKDHADRPLLAQMNDEFAVILGYGNNTVVMVERGRMNVQTSAPEPVFQTFQTFRNRIRNYPSVEIQVGDKIKHVSAFDWWTSHGRRREFLDVAFEPGVDTPGRFNLWTGFSVQPAIGKEHERWLEHLFENICDGVQEHYEYLIRWMARVVQHPRTQSMVAPVLIGRRGAGKSVCTDTFSVLFAPHRYVGSDARELTGKFNAHLGQCLVVIGEEIFDMRDSRHTSVLKELITGRTIGIERKNVDRILMPNYVHLILTSNPDTAGNRIVPAGDHERRFFVLRVGNKQVQRSSYFAPILRARDEGQLLSHLLYHLMDVSLADFDVTKFPLTDALREQQEQNLSYELEWLLHKLETGRWISDRADVSWKGPVRKDLLYVDYQQYMENVRARSPKGRRAFHKFIMNALPGTTDMQAHIKGEGRPMVFNFMSLDRCRQAFDDARGWKTHWADVESQEPGEVVEMRKDVF